MAGISLGDLRYKVFFFCSILSCVAVIISVHGISNAFISYVKKYRRGEGAFFVLSDFWYVAKTNIRVHYFKNARRVSRNAAMRRIVARLQKSRTKAGTRGRNEKRQPFNRNGYNAGNARRLLKAD